MRLRIALFITDIVISGLCAVNVYVALTFGGPLNWAAAVFIALVAVRTKPVV